MKSCYSEHFGTHYDMALDAGIFYRGYKKVCLIPVLPSQLFGYLRNLKKVKFRYSKIQFSTLSYFDLLNFFLKWQLNTLFFLISKIQFLFFKKPIDLIKNIYIEDQFISFCLRHPIQLFSKRNSYRYNPNLLTYFWAIYNFIYGITLSEFIFSLNKKNKHEVFLSHEINAYASFVRKSSSLGMKITIPLKLPFSYSIKPYTNFSRFSLPSFLNSFNKKFSDNNFKDGMSNISKRYLLRRLNPLKKELFYLRVSPYKSSMKDKYSKEILKYNFHSQKYVVLYLHKFTDDLHRYGMDDFDTIWDWTIFTINQLLILTNFPIYVKIHPNTDNKSIHLVHRLEKKVVDELIKLFSTNERIIFLNKDFSNKSIICENSSAIVITHHGNIICEALHFNIRTIASSMSPWNNLKDVSTWKTKSQYKKIIRSLNNEKIIKKNIVNKNFDKTIIFYYHDKELKTYQLYSFYIIEILKNLKFKIDYSLEKSDSHSFNLLNSIYKDLHLMEDRVLYDSIITRLSKKFANSYYI